MDKTILEEKKGLLSTEYIPKYDRLYVHPEEGEEFKFNDAFNQIYDDMKFIDNFMITKSNDLANLVRATVERLDNIDLGIKSEQERLQDIKMLCNKYTDFDNVIPITSTTSMQGEYSVANDTFYAAIDKQENTKLTVKNVAGNGLEGNKYVYQDFAYVQDSVDTSNRGYLVDGSINSLYEYERITVSPTEEYMLSDFNTDSEPAKCTISFYSPKEINLITVNSDDTALSVTGVQYSYDGVDYYPLEIPNIRINDKLACYDNYDYVCGDNKILLPRCNYTKITFQANGTTDDAIAYDRVMFWHEIPKTDEEKAEEDAADGIIGGNIGTNEPEKAPPYNSLTDATVPIKSAKRSAIKINDISAVSNIYKTSSYFTTRELITDDKFYSVGLFLNAYIPEDLSHESVQFILTINGIDYEASPVNYSGSGHKIFRYSQGKSLPEYTQLLEEPIKSLTLTVKMVGTGEFTPFIGNIKVLLGGDI